MYHILLCAITFCMSRALVLYVVVNSKIVVCDMYYRKEVCSIKIFRRFHMYYKEIPEIPFRKTKLSLNKE